MNSESPVPFIALVLVWLCVAASRAHHPERRPGDCDEARDHPGVRQAPRPPGEGGQRLRLLRTSRQVAGRAENRTDSDTGRTTFKVQLLPWIIYLVPPIFFYHVLYLYIKYSFFINKIR